MGDIYLNGIRYGGLSGPSEGDQVYVNPIVNQGIKIAEITVNDTTDSLYAPGGVTDVEVDGTSVVSQQGIAEIDLSGKQDSLTAGTNISIDSTTNTISATDTTYNVFSTGSNGLVPAPTSADSAKVLQGDGTWVAQTGGTDVEANPSSAATDTLNKIGIDGTVYGIAGGGSASAISDLTDVTLTNLTNGQILKYDSTSQKWVNADETGGGGSNVGKSILAWKNITPAQYTALSAAEKNNGVIYFISASAQGDSGFITQWKSVTSAPSTSDNTLYFQSSSANGAMGIQMVESNTIPIATDNIPYLVEGV